MEIAKELNKENILPPRLYKIEKYIISYNIDKSTNCWNSRMINYILRNRTIYWRFNTG